MTLVSKNKEHIFGFGTYILFSVIWGILTAILEDNGLIAPISFLTGIVSLIVSIFFQIIFHELGHLEAGLFSGYQFSSFRVGHLLWIKEDGKIRLKKYSMNGTLGQCLMIPPENKGYHYPVVFYNLGGVIMNFIVSGIGLILTLALRRGEFLIFSLVGVVLAITNGVPMKVSGLPNDGMNAKCLKKDPLAVQVIDSQLKMNTLLMKGVRLKDMPNEWFELPKNSDFSNIYIGNMLCVQIARILDNHDFFSAKEKIQWALDNASGMLEIYKNELKCELMFCEIMLGNYIEAEKIYEYEMKKYIEETSNQLSRRRLMYAYYFLVEKDHAKAKKELEIFNHIKKAYPYKADIESEEELTALINDEVRV